MNEIKEQWKDIIGFETLYQVSNLSRVRSLRKNIIMKPSLDGGGYYFIYLCVNGKTSISS